MKSEDNKKTKIVMFGHKRMPSREGGIEVVVEELSTRMAEKGYEVTCYNRKGHHVSGKAYDENQKYKGVNIESVFTINRKGIAAMTSSLSAVIKAAFSDADVVHIHAEGPAAMCFIPKMFGKRVVVTIHGLDWQRSKWDSNASRYIKWGEKQAVRHADEIIVLSRNVKQYFKDTYNRETVYIPNGVNKPEIREAKEIKDIWNLDKDSYVLFLGRIVPEKGIKYLLQAWKGISTDKKLVICGGSSDTEEFMNELKSEATDNVIFTGFQQGRVLEELYSNAYVYCLPSDLEGMPLSLLEAMSYGNCCLISDIDECTEVVEDKAVTFKHGDVEDLRSKLQHLLDDEELVNRYKATSSEYITNKYSWDEVVYKTLNLYRG